MGIAILTFAIFFILLSAAGSVVFYRGGARRRLSRAVAEPKPIDFLYAPPARPGARDRRRTG